MGVKHTQAALADTESCSHYSVMPTRVLEWWLRVAASSKGDEEEAQASRPVSMQSGNVALMVVDCNIVEVCKHAAAKLDIPWPVTPGDLGVKRDIYDGKRLSNCSPLCRRA
ncbi:hypothetical protein QQF64_036070 [Cirrhinus molitorella]|uniref:Uncharacterized protein n=1 Tax=Cirrhinus molitorella TaxID=172907 RepID=A0ABR3NI65_9TELE